MPKKKTRSSTLRPPNPEQAEIIDGWSAKTAQILVDAGAGTGKTSTLEMCAHATIFREGRYITFSKAMAKEAKGKFPKNTTCTTAHGLAWGCGMRELYADRVHGKARRRMRSADVGTRLGMQEIQLKGYDDKLRLITASALGESVLIGLRRFSHSDRREFEPWMIKTPDACDNEESELEFREYVMPFLRRAWKDAVDPNGVLPFEQDFYLKIWALTNPKLETEFVMFDEAQDASAAMADVVRRQTHAQIMLVGDRCQSIYHWRGAVDAMSSFSPDASFMLTQSYRFGDAIANEANKWLSYLKADLRLRGHSEIQSTIGIIPVPDAVLCRTNIGAMVEIVGLVRDRKRVAFVGRAAPLREFAEAAQQLQINGITSHPELCGFNSWRDLTEYVKQEEAGQDLRVYVDLVDTYGASRVIEILDQLVDEKNADVIVSTAHGAKGREWPRVRIARDFTESPYGPGASDAMLAYVTVTRAKIALDRGSLEYIDKFQRDPA